MSKKISLLVILFSAIGALMSAATLDGTRYVGIGKVDGSPVDFWASIEFDDTDAEINVGNAYGFLASYSQTGSNSVTLAVPGSPKCLLKSTDNGQSYQGTLTINGSSIRLWLLKVPRKLKKAEGDATKLTETLTAPDGYTSFVQLSKAGGLFSVTSDFFFHSNGRFGISCDSPSLQRMFENIKGEFQVEGSDVKLKLDSGATINGTIYDQGNYISIPVGYKDGMDMTIILIR